MSRLLDTVQLSLRVPRGIDGFWTIVRQLDDAGAWTITEAAKRAGVHKRTMNEFVRGLAVAGIAKAVGERAPKGGVFPAALYRLDRRPQTAPNLSRDGQPRPEDTIDVLWRTMKIAKVFTAAELAELASTPERPVKLSTANAYLRDLAHAGIVAGSGRGRDERFRLVVNIGARAPKILVTRVVFDPNAKAAVGQPLAREVSP